MDYLEKSINDTAHFTTNTYKKSAEDWSLCNGMGYMDSIVDNILSRDLDFPEEKEREIEQTIRELILNV